MNINEELIEHENALKSFDEESVYKAANILCKTLSFGSKILICGNGGSAADAQHFAAELCGRFKCERAGLKAISLATDTSVLTAVGNDYGFDEIFARQVEALAQKGDLLICISTSGNSANIIRAARVARELGVGVLSLTGRDGGELLFESELNINVANNDTARIQEAHIFIIHCLCQAVDEAKDMFKASH